jgi:hypothetical protein
MNGDIPIFDFEANEREPVKNHAWKIDRRGFGVYDCNGGFGTRPDTDPD